MSQVIQDNQLLNRIRQRDNQAVKELYKIAFNYCTTFIVKNQGTQVDAREIFQECMMILLQKLQDKDFNINCNVKSYLYAICRNQWLNERKKRGKTDAIITEDGKEIVLIDDTSGSEAAAEKENKFTRIFQQLKTASEDCQKLIQLTFFKKLSDKEIAPLMDYSLEFVRNKRRRCIGSLRKKLGVK